MNMRDFLRAASKQERAAVAAACHGSVAYLYQLAGKHRFASALMAMHLEERTREVAAESAGRLHPVPRESLVRHPEVFHWTDRVSREGTTSAAAP